MKLTKRKTVKRISSQKMSAPSYRRNPETQEKEFHLAFVNTQFNPQSVGTSQDLFLYAAGRNEEGELPDGLDRLTDHDYTIHLDDAGNAIGLDIVPSRVYRSGVIPASQLNVTTVSVIWEVNGTVCRVLKRPAGTTSATLKNLILQLDAMANSNTPINTNTKIGDLGRVERIDGDIVEIRLKSKPSAGRALFDIGDDD
jgi:hypothetical protein